MNGLNAYVVSNIGNVRENHEDNFYIPIDKFISEEKQKSIKSNKVYVDDDYEGKDGAFVVCDGMGGHNAGEVASRLAISKVRDEYKELQANNKETLIGFIKKLNNYICEYSDKNKDCANMGSTFSGLFIFNGEMNLLQVGDSRIYKLEKEKFIQISRDHTEGCRLVESGVIKVEDLSKFPNRKSLYKYLGRNGELIADCVSIQCQKGDRFIISSDGLSDTLTYEEIKIEVCNSDSAKNVCKRLLDKCLKKGNACNDNVTIICIDVY